MHGYQGLQKITNLEFVEYYMHVSTLIESDSAFNQLILGVWNLDNSDNPSIVPFAGAKKKILTVDPKQRYLVDNYKNALGKSNAPYDMGKENGTADWRSSSS